MIKNLIVSFSLIFLSASTAQALSLTGTDVLGVLFEEKQAVTNSEAELVNQSSQSMTDSVSGSTSFFSFDAPASDFLKDSINQGLPNFDPSSASRGGTTRLPALR